MLADRLEQKLPVNAIEEALDVEIEHPVVAPAALAGFRHGTNRRFAGPVAKGVRMKYRLQDRLQISASDFLSNAVGDRWNAQRPDATTCFRNVDAPHRRGEVAP
jgi:hypothetical protein